LNSGDDFKYKHTTVRNVQTFSRIVDLQLDKRKQFGMSLIPDGILVDESELRRDAERIYTVLNKLP
jgi:hypothetical protein